jgi:hypothetical protein
MNIYSLGFGVLLLASVAFPVNVSRGSGFTINIVFPITALLCAAWILEILVYRRRAGFEPSRVASASLFFVMVTILSFVSGQYPYFRAPGAPMGAQVAGLGLSLLSIGLFLTAGHKISDIRILAWLTWLFLAVGGIFCLTQVVPGITAWVRWSSPESVGGMFWIWMVAIGSSQALLNRQLSTFARLMLAGLVALVFFRGLFQTVSWTSGWLPPLVALATILLFRIPRTMVGLGLVALPGALYYAGHVRDMVMQSEQYSWLTRIEALKVLWALYEKNPILGLGPANYPHYTLLYPILGWYVHFNSHNNYADLLMQSGLLGLMSFCWFVFEAVRMIVRMLRSGSMGDFGRAYVIGALGGTAGALVSGMLADWIIPFYYNIGIRGFRSSLFFWFFLGGVMALRRTGWSVPSLRPVQ